VIRDGQETEVSVTLEARPAEKIQAAIPLQESDGRAWLGIVGLPLSPAIAEDMDLPDDTQGVLIIHVEEDSPASEADLQGGDEPTTIDGEETLIGGDVITAVDETAVDSVQDLAEYLQEVGAGAEVSLSVIRDGKQINIIVTLAERP
jgi:S1-C subfamily serine protease